MEEDENERGMECMKKTQHETNIQVSKGSAKRMQPRIDQMCGLRVRCVCAADLGEADLVGSVQTILVTLVNLRNTNSHTRSEQPTKSERTESARRTNGKGKRRKPKAHTGHFATSFPCCCTPLPPSTAVLACVLPSSYRPMRRLPLQWQRPTGREPQRA
jgi:hypothetical protein